ncbi:MAG: iron-siderophore ABC transporter substrate-binding protein [Actinomycetota bacterium]
MTLKYSFPCSPPPSTATHHGGDATTKLLLDPPVDDLTRREFITGGLAALLLAGCARTNDEVGDQAEAQAGFPVTIEHAYGSTEVPSEPKRIVTVGLNDHDPVFALGGRPLASSTWFSETVINPWAQEAAAGAAPQAFESYEPNVEAIAALQPDLILGIFGGILEQGQYDLLSRIAPTVAGHPDFAVYETPWQEQTRMIGRALGRSARAEELVAGVERDFAAAAARHPEWEGASAVLASLFEQGRLGVYPGATPATSFLEQLGFVIPAELDEFFDESLFVAAISPERLDLIDRDLIVVDSPDQLRASGFLDLPTYRNLEAVRQGRVVFPTSEVADGLSFRTVLSLPWVLKRLEPMIVAAFDGDPATEVP